MHLLVYILEPPSYLPNFLVNSPNLCSMRSLNTETYWKAQRGFAHSPGCNSCFTWQEMWQLKCLSFSWDHGTTEFLLLFPMRKLLPITKREGKGNEDSSMQVIYFSLSGVYIFMFFQNISIRENKNLISQCLHWESKCAICNPSIPWWNPWGEVYFRIQHFLLFSKVIQYLC